MNDHIKLIDPPSGWRYGFPKPYDNPNNLPIKDWLLQNGYPESEMDKNGEPFWVRFIDEN